MLEVILSFYAGLVGICGNMYIAIKTGTQKDPSPVENVNGAELNKKNYKENGRMDRKHRIRELLLIDLDEDYFSLLCELSGENQTLNKSVVKSCWDRYANNLDHCTFVCEDVSSRPRYRYPYLSGKIIGTASALIEHKMLHYGSKVGHIEDVVVANRTRAKGIGKSLVERCIEFCRTNGCYKVILDCSNENIPFYENCGFRVVQHGMRRDFKGADK